MTARGLGAVVAAGLLGLAAIAGAQRPAPSHLPRLDPATGRPDAGVTVTLADGRVRTTYRDGWTRTVEREDGGARETYRDTAGRVQEIVESGARGALRYRYVLVEEIEPRTTTAFEEWYQKGAIVQATRAVTTDGRTIRYRWDPARRDWAAASLTDAIQLLVDAIYGRVFAVAAALSAIGLVSMAILQTVKDAFPVRRLFQRWWVRRWLAAQARRAEAAGAVAGAATAPPEPPPAEEDLLRLATGADARAFYDLPIEQLCAQMNAAAGIVLDYPWRHGPLLHALSAGADAADLQALLDVRPVAEKPRSQQTEEDRRRLGDILDPRTRVGHQIQRNIDALQIAAGFRWRLTLQVAAIAVSGALVVVAFWMLGEPPQSAYWWLYLLGAILSGFLAPVARDLVAALQQLRK